MGEVLSEEDVNAIRRWSHGQAADEAEDLHALCDSHEELRRQRDEAQMNFDTELDVSKKWAGENDAQRARIAELEAEVERVRAFCEVEVVAALRLQLEQSLAEVERLRGVVVESDKDLVANTARKIARDHNMPLKSAELMMLEALRVVRSNDNRDRDAAIARAEKAEKERDAWQNRAELRGVEYNAAIAAAPAKDGPPATATADETTAVPLCPRCVHRANCLKANLDRFHDYDFARCKMFVEEPTERRTR